MSRLEGVKEPTSGAVQGTGEQGMEVEQAAVKAVDTGGPREVISGKPKGTEVGEKAEPGREDRSRPCVAAASQPAAFEITTGTFEVTAEGPVAEVEQHQAALNQLIRLFGHSQAVQILERYVLAPEPITLDQAREQTAVEVPGLEQLQEAAQLLLQEKQIAAEDVIDLASEEDEDFD